MEDGDSIFLLMELRGGKPVIYFLSPQTREAEVKLSLVPQWNLSAIYPVVPIKPRTTRSNEQVAWRVRTHANGDLTELTTGLDVAYLFWESQYVFFFYKAGIPFLMVNLQYRFYRTIPAFISAAWRVDSNSY
jgi:hypothetical protein